MKPVACGNQAYSSGTLRSPATISAILFSKPWPCSFENGRLAGSAQTRNVVRLTRSTRWACAAPAPRPPPASASATAKATCRLLATEAGLFRSVRGRRLFDPLGGATARQRAVGTRLQVKLDVVDVAHDVGVIPQRRHLALLVRAHHLASAGDHQHEIGVAHGLQGFDQAGGIGRALAIGTVTDVS